ncbi:hypothetical protein [Bacillus sp. FJAT-50079]|nr:hypothetical protein [Bacillus sp. FJAT-50079]
METTAFVLAIVAFVFALTGRSETNRLKKKIEELERKINQIN